MSEPTVVEQDNAEDKEEREIADKAITEAEIRRTGDVLILRELRHAAAAGFISVHVVKMLLQRPWDAYNWLAHDGMEDMIEDGEEV